MLKEIPITENIKQCRNRLFNKEERSMCAQGIILYGCGWHSWKHLNDKDSGERGTDYYRDDAISLLIRESHGEDFEKALQRWRKIQLMNDEKEKTFLEIAEMLRIIGL